MLVTEPMELSRLQKVVQEAVLGGVNVVNLRDRSASCQELTRLAKALRIVATGACYIVNGQVEDQLPEEVCGVHLPEHGGSVDGAREIVRDGGLVGRSVHSMEASKRAAEEGADYLIVGTIFASGSHPEVEPAGLGLVREVCDTFSVPVIAIGGITPENAADCMKAGAAGIAVLSGILHAADPRAAATLYRRVLTGFTGEQYGASCQR